jgi:hypothetical protein
MLVVQDKFIGQWLCQLQTPKSCHRHIGTTALLNTWARQNDVDEAVLKPLVPCVVLSTFQRG